jgi:hypothetical protein
MDGNSDGNRIAQEARAILDAGPEPAQDAKAPAREMAIEVPVKVIEGPPPTWNTEKAEAYFAKKLDRLASRPADAALRKAAGEMAEAVALLPASDGRILGLLPILCRLQAALASSPVEDEMRVTETSDPAQAARWLGKTVESTNAFGDDSDWPGHWSDNNGGDDGGEWIKDPYRGKLSSVFAEGVYIDEEPVKWPIRLVEDEKEGANEL